MNYCAIPALAIWVLLACCTSATRAKHTVDSKRVHPTEEPSAQSNDSPQPACGDGLLSSGERCDDGNLRSGDGCTESCRLEAVGFIEGAAVLSNGALVALPPLSNTQADSQFAPDSPRAVCLRHGHHGAVLDTAPPSVISAYPQRPIQVPVELASVSWVGGSSSYVELIALENGEVWRLLEATLIQKSCLAIPGMDREAGPTADGHRWCRLRRRPNPVVSMAGHCWVERGGKMSCLHDFIAVDIGDRVAKKISGTQHRCVLTEEGEVGCWGSASLGELGYMGEGPVFRSEGDPESFEHQQSPSRWLRFDSPAVDVLALAGKTIVVLEDGQVWAWGDVKGPFVGTESDQPYYERMGSPASSGEWSREFYAPGTSTLPAGPLQLPEGCRVKAIGDGCVICESGCLMCFHDTASLAASECLLF